MCFRATNRSGFASERLPEILKQVMLIKICGITKPNDAAAAIAAGADLLGVNLVAGPRQIALDQAVWMLGSLGDPSQVVALVRWSAERHDRETRLALKEAGVATLQLYGPVDALAIAAVASEGFRSILVCPGCNRADLEAIGPLLRPDNRARPDYVLFDATSPVQLGGTGQRADWAGIARADTSGALEGWPPIMLAGGLNPDNAQEAIRQVRPSGVDVCSGVESSPGRKDTKRVEAFIHAVRSV